MSTPQANSPPAPAPAAGNDTAPTPRQALHRLFLTLFLRGRTSRGLQRDRVPQSIVSKLALTLLLYTLLGSLAFAFQEQPIFALSVYLHGMTFAFLGMFVASSAGEILFNREEADILLHRPIDAKTLLAAKVRVLVEVSLWLAFAFNLAGFFVGVGAPQGSWLFLPVHAISIGLEALFCTATIVMVYQLCLRWCGRERLENLMTAAQIVVSVVAVVASQLVPRLLFRGNGQVLEAAQQSAWIVALPPAWFAGIDDALTGGFALRSCLLALAALAATAIVCWLALDRLAGDYRRGLLVVNENIAQRPSQLARRRLQRLVDAPPLRWCLRDPVTRASFLLSAAYLTRDRDVKLRVYPGMAPVVMMPVVMLVVMEGKAEMGGFLAAMCGAYIGLAPMMALAMLQYSQHWQATDVFRTAPQSGPAAICAGARQAVVWLLALPALVAVSALLVLVHGTLEELPLVLSGIVAMPVYLLLPNRGGRGVPLSQPVDEAVATGRGLGLVGITFVALGLAGLANFCWRAGYFWLLMPVEIAIVALLYVTLRRRIARAPWPTSE